MSLEQAAAETVNMDTWDNHASTEFAGGSGTWADPYRIATPAQLAYFAKQSRTTILNNIYSLENSLDMSDYIWLGIGSYSSYPFCGYFNGNFNTVSGIIINDKTKVSSYIGFFNYVGGGTIENLILENGTITSNDANVGCLAGRVYTGWNNDDCNIQNCIVENYTMITSSLSGGLIANSNGTEYNSGEDIAWVIVSNCILRDCKFISRNGIAISAIYEEDGEYTDIYNCGIIDVSFISLESGFSNGIIPYKSYNCYAKTSYINMATGINEISKIMTSDRNNTWNYWFFNTNINDGYPVPKSLFSIGSVSGQTGLQVYNHLLSLGFTTV